LFNFESHITTAVKRRRDELGDSKKRVTQGDLGAKVKPSGFKESCFDIPLVQELADSPMQKVYSASNPYFPSLFSRNLEKFFSPSIQSFCFEPLYLTYCYKYPRLLI
jgi:hypothetical protein